MRSPSLSYIPTQQLLALLFTGIFEFEFLLVPLNYNVYEGDSGPLEGKQKQKKKKEH